MSPKVLVLGVDPKVLVLGVDSIQRNRSEVGGCLSTKYAFAGQ